ncbi:hypothetical protein CRG98_010657 [Punica granatum]|uniref:Retrotransposon gag domain-containing protein n=1 Tax=Punica granatum TaxID=22663 RepID=A0A2I0KKC2_PUNGR|nr:hypothetical protein CRG98_010657 [Punica granatum]
MVLTDPSTHVPEIGDAPAPPTTPAPAVYPVNVPLPPPSAPTAVLLRPAAFLTLDPVMFAPLLVFMPIPIYTAPPPMVRGHNRLEAPPPLLPGRMLQYWDYEEFIVHTFQDSLTGPAFDWFMTLKAADIPILADLSRRFIDQFQYYTETPPTLLELSMKEMA